MGRSLLLGVILLLVGLTAGAQETRIRIVDDSDGKPVPFCHICLENKSTGEKIYIVGDVNGEAVLQTGRGLVMSISAIGYEHFLREGIGEGELLEARLKPSYFGLDEVVVTGQYNPVSADKSIYNIKLIGKPRMENLAANNMTDLLSKELAFSVNRSSATGTSLNLQGISGENVKILIDGVPVIGRLEGNIDLDQLNLQNVAHVEIVEGPMSVMYGSNALAGVVNIITGQKTAARLKGGIQNYYESVGTYNVNANTSINNGPHTLSLNGGRNFFGGHSLVEGARYQEYKPKEQYVGGLSYGYNTGPFSLRYKSDLFRERLLDRTNLLPPYHEIGYETWTTTLRFNNSLHLRRNLTSGGNLHLLAAYSYYDRSRESFRKDLTDLSSTFTGSDSSTFTAFTARGGINQSLDDRNLSYQVGFDIQTELGRGDRISSGEEFMGDFALFTSLQWSPVEQLTIQPALRASYNTDYKSPLTPTLNIRYQGQSTIYRFTYARGFRAPSLKELYLNFYDSNHELEGNPDLIAERSHNFNFSVSDQFQIRTKPLEIKGKLFYNVIDDKISLVLVDPENLLHYRNVNTGHFESVGGDVSLRFFPVRQLSLRAGAAYIGTQDDYYFNEEFLFMPTVTGDLTLNFYKNRATASVYYKYSGKNPVPRFDDEGEIVVRFLEPYHNMDLNLSVKLFRQKLRLGTGIKNLFDNTTLAGVSGGSGHGGTGGASSLVGWGRTFFISLNYNFMVY